MGASLDGSTYLAYMPSDHTQATQYCSTFVPTCRRSIPLKLSLTNRPLHCLFQIPCRGCHRRRPHGCPGGLSEGVPGGVRDRQEQDAADPPHQARTRAQLLRLLLRDHQLARPGVSLGQTGRSGGQGGALSLHIAVNLVGGHLFRRFCNTVCFLKVPLACLGSMAAAVEPNSLENSQKKVNKTFGTSGRPTRYSYSKVVMKPR